MSLGKILIVDDSEILRFEICSILTEAGYEVVEGVDGNDGLQKAKEIEDIDLIYSDYNMNGLDGLSMLQEIRKLPAHQKTKLAVLTTESSVTLKEKGREIGVLVWILKPIKKENFLAANQAIFKKIAAAS